MDKDGILHSDFHNMDIRRFQELVEELNRVDALVGKLTTRGGRRIKGMAFLMGDITADSFRQILNRTDFSLPISSDGLRTLNYVKQLQSDNTRLTELAVTDNLTGLYNVRHFWERLEVELERVRRTERPCSLVMMDLDHFKPVNDEYGHQAGDEVLRVVAEIIKQSVRAVDVPVRYGGDEFAVILPDTGARAAYLLAERIRQKIVDDPRNVRYGVTASFGLATQHHFDRESKKVLADRSDQALYMAKHKGGNQTWFFEADRLKEEPTGITLDERDSLYCNLADI